MNVREYKKRSGRPPLAAVTNEIKLSFPSLSANESFARAAVAAFISQLDPTPTELADIKCVLSEAVTNCIVHAYKDCIGDVKITVKVRADRSVSIEVKDSGVGIENVEEARQPLFTTGAAEERSGMGFTVMESFCDKLKIRSKLCRGTTVIMTKRLTSKPKASSHT
jgi:stage II sporulation protein AB (anti-sigma F factor)